MKKIITFLLLTFIIPFLNAENDPVTIVIFGATGDLAAKKLYPAFFNLNVEKELNPNFTLIGVGRREWDDKEFQETVHQSLIIIPETNPPWKNGKHSNLIFII